MAELTTSVDRPTICPCCGNSISLMAVIVKVGDGPWTCERCDGSTEVKWLDIPKFLRRGKD